MQIKEADFTEAMKRIEQSVQAAREADLEALQIGEPLYQPLVTRDICAAMIVAVEDLILQIPSGKGKIFLCSLETNFDPRFAEAMCLCKAAAPACRDSDSEEKTSPVLSLSVRNCDDPTNYFRQFSVPDDAVYGIFTPDEDSADRSIVRPLICVRPGERQLPSDQLGNLLTFVNRRLKAFAPGR